MLLLTIKCNNSFPSDSGLRRHVREQHIEARQSCQICGDLFVRKYKLTIHKRTVHKGMPAVILTIFIVITAVMGRDGFAREA